MGLGAFFLGEGAAFFGEFGLVAFDPGGDPFFVVGVFGVREFVVVFFDAGFEVGDGDGADAGGVDSRVTVETVGVDFLAVGLHGKGSGLIGVLGAVS